MFRVVIHESLCSKLKQTKRKMKPASQIRYDRALALMSKAYSVFRLKPGEDLYDSITRMATRNGPASHAVVTCVGSLTLCRVRLAGASASQQEFLEINGPLEIVSLVGTIADDRAHLHISVADGKGEVKGGHLVTGSKVETTAEVVLVDLRSSLGIVMTRERDESTGFRELVVKQT